MRAPAADRRADGPLSGRTALLVLLLLSVIHTWPIARAPAHESLHLNADAEMSAWTLSWIAHALPRHPSALFDGNIFAPEPHVLVYSEPMLTPALMGAPVRWLGGSPVLTYNLVLIAGLTLTAWAGWLAAYRWTGSSSAALVAGALLAFNGHLLTRLAHIVAAHMWGVPLALWLSDRILDAPTRRRLLALAAVVAATAVTSAYTLALVGICVGLVMIAGGVMRRWTAVAAIAAAVCGGLAVAAPVLWPYVRFAATGVHRPLEQVADFSASWPGYLTSLSNLHAGWSHRFFRDDVNVFFAGFTALALALVGLLAAARQRSDRRRTILLMMVGLAGVILSLGPATPLYRWLYEWVPGLRGLRAAARFGYLYLAAVGLAASYGLCTLERRAGSRPARFALTAVALTLVTVEAWSGPVPTRHFTRVPRIYQSLATDPDPVLLVEVPFYPVDGFWGNGEYVVNSTAHWRPLMNGYSGFVPDSYRRRAAAFWFFPEDWAIDAIKHEGATHVMVHLEKFTPTEVADIQLQLRRRPDLQLVASDPAGHRLFRFR